MNFSRNSKITSLRGRYDRSNLLIISRLLHGVYPDKGRVRNDGLIFRCAILFSLFFTAFLFNSCEKVVTNVELPQTTPKLVITSFISPNIDTLEVYISKSKPVFESQQVNNDFITNANIIISDESASATIPYDAYNYRYMLPASSFQIIKGKSYKLSVSTPDGLSAEATCSVPAFVNNSLEIYSIDSISDSDRTFIKYRFTDIAGQENYYRVISNIDKAMVYFDDYQIPDILISDKNTDGNTFSFQAEIGKEIPLNIISVYLLTTDKDYYNYQKSISNYSSGDPFSEPTLIYSNVNGGLGVFCGYNQFRKSLQKK